MYNAFKKTFAKVLNNGPGMDVIWDFRSNKYFGFVSGNKIQFFSRDLQEEEKTASRFFMSNGL